MQFDRIEIDSFRNIVSITLNPVESLNFLCGPNAAGKTAILEALFLLSTGRSFRQVNSSELIMKEKSAFVIRAIFRDTNNKNHQIGVMKTRERSIEYKLNGESVATLSDITKLLPISVIHPDMHSIILGGPSIRRKFIDWGVFYLYADFFPAWKGFQFALKQRNHLLKGSYQNKELQSWNKELASSGEVIHSIRKRYMANFLPLFQSWIEKFRIYEDISVTYNSGWSSEISLLEALLENESSCKKYKTTTLGPHRADMILETNGVKAKHYLSRGQQKLLVFALIFSQISLFRNIIDDSVVLLCDDPKSELDDDHWNVFISALEDLKIQCFITGSSKDYFHMVKQSNCFQLRKGTLEKMTTDIAHSST